MHLSVTLLIQITARMSTCNLKESVAVRDIGQKDLAVAEMWEGKGTSHPAVELKLLTPQEAILPEKLNSAIKATNIKLLFLLSTDIL